MIIPTDQDRDQALKDVARHLHEMPKFFLDPVVYGWVDALAKGWSESRAREIALERALRFVLPVLKREQECREQSYLPDPDVPEQGYLEEIRNAVDVAQAALSEGSSKG